MTVGVHRRAAVSPWHLVNWFICQLGGFSYQHLQCWTMSEFPAPRLWALPFTARSEVAATHKRIRHTLICPKSFKAVQRQLTWDRFPFDIHPASVCSQLFTLHIRPFQDSGCGSSRACVLNQSMFKDDVKRRVAIKPAGACRRAPCVCVCVFSDSTYKASTDCISSFSVIMELKLPLVLFCLCALAITSTEGKKVAILKPRRQSFYPFFSEFK